ncbi:TerB family tellurite resistance protein [Pseudoalteromonas sp. JBTF-M23]|uniref:TerB family tellurite resistance protein n=1 Tax=Pseudoalteromonas caenipelagi TaxID=2726988 RepID=A0A849VGH7_9GAMM|nr:TerB family tellurite resistance protein [Pseudoalteromonas caenipelagi]NOU51890.1 TerB family tellurite resistance protein [Pseudoalteromonas caenipelagi]
MLNHLKKLLQSNTPKTVGHEVLDFNTALAALLVEVMRADGKLLDSEFDKISHILTQRCQLSAEQTTALIDKAQKLVEHAIDLFAFVKQINQHTSDIERIDIIELLWHVAFADGHLDSHEDHIIRKISGLLYVAHPDFISAKLAAQESAAK